MNPRSNPRTTQTRPAQQRRSRDAQTRITAAVVELIAEHGIHGVTHRRVAARAGVSLAATTYYYASKFDILAEASRANMQVYTDAFKAAVGRVDDDPPGEKGFGRFALRLLRNVTTKHRSGTLAWAEITLAGIRQADGAGLARDWAAHITEEWASVAQGYGCGDPVNLARSGVDTITGLIFMVLGLDLSAKDVDAVFTQGGDPLVLWCPNAHPQYSPTKEVSGLSLKARETRSRIIATTIETLKVDGPGLVNFRQIAMRTGLSQSALSYYFNSADDLMQVAQFQLFHGSKDRYRAALPKALHTPGDIDDLVDLTATVFQREVVEFGRQNLATFTIWLEAARRPELRPLIWDAISDQARAWQRMIVPVSSLATPLDGLLAQAMFVGKMVRILSSGVHISDLVKVRREFREDFQSLFDQKFWLNSGTDTLKQLT